MPLHAGDLLLFAAHELDRLLARWAARGDEGVDVIARYPNGLPQVNGKDTSSTQMQPNGQPRLRMR